MQTEIVQSGHFRFVLFQIFAGNLDRHTVVSHDLKNPIIAKVIRINPITWHSYICLRAEFYGCREGKDEITLITHICFSIVNITYYLKVIGSNVS